MPRIIWKEPPENLARSLALWYLMRVKSSIACIDDFTLIKTFQVDDLYEEDLPKPHIWYTTHQIKYLQMTDPSLALIINKLQKGNQPKQPLPNT